MRRAKARAIAVGLLTHSPETETRSGQITRRSSTGANPLRELPRQRSCAPDMPDQLLACTILPFRSTHIRKICTSFAACEEDESRDQIIFGSAHSIAKPWCPRLSQASSQSGAPLPIEGLFNKAFHVTTRQVIAEPGRYLVETSHILFARIYAKRMVKLQGVLARDVAPDPSCHYLDGTQ